MTKWARSDAVVNLNAIRGDAVVVLSTTKVDAVVM